jgi:superfamily II RNA helicase
MTPEVASKIFEVVCDLKTYGHLSNDQIKYMKDALSTIGFPKDSALLDSDLAIDELESAKFQLEYLGPTFLRKQHPIYFPHNDISFYPDDWQHKLLKLLEKRESVLVVAPTSSGKSFVSYFTISTVLSETRPRKDIKMKSRVVFVSPTHSLANQMAATVSRQYSQFKFGIFTRFFQNLRTLINFLGTGESTCGIVIY